MSREPILKRSAVIALARATLPGPNCQHRQGFEQFLNFQKDSARFADLTPYFTMGPDHFLTAYAVCNGVYELEDYDIVGAYCLDHLPMVMAAEKIFQTKGFENEYFEEMRKRGFKLRVENLAEYLFSCLGKIGEILNIDHQGSFRLARVLVRADGKFVILENVVLPEGEWLKVNDLVAMHFASAFARVPQETAREISNCQLRIPRKSPFVARLALELPESIDYSDFLSQNLTQYTQEKLSSK